MMDLIIEMAASNNYTFARAPEYMRFSLDEAWQVELSIIIVNIGYAYNTITDHTISLLPCTWIVK